MHYLAPHSLHYTTHYNFHYTLLSDGRGGDLAQGKLEQDRDTVSHIAEHGVRRGCTHAGGEAVA